jgi:hypothetical protein
MNATLQRTFNEGNLMAATAIATTEPKPATNPMALIQAAIERGIDPDQLGKLMDLQERHERNRAAETFGTAIAEFQRRCPRVHKGRKVDAGPLRYQYASFDDVMYQAGPHLSACGIALSFSTEANDKGIRVTVKVRVGIHAEESTLDVPVPDMKVNGTQRYGAALSYAKRYALCAALNIVVTDDVDDDANSCFDPITDEQEIEIAELIEAKGADKAKFLAWMGVTRIIDIPASDFNKAVVALRSKK